MTGQFSRVGPIIILLAVLVVGAALGYLWAASDVEIVDTGLWQLQVSYQGIYVQAVADAYAFDGNDALASDRLSFLCQQNGGLEAALSEAAARYGADPVKLANLDQLRTLVGSGQVQQNNAVQVCNNRSPNPLVPAIVPVALLVVIGLAIVGAGVFRLIRVSEEAAAPARPAAATPATGTPAPAGAPERQRATLPGILGRKKPDTAGETVPSAAARGAQISAQVQKTDFTAQGAEPPLVQFMTTYLHGDDLYDDSFSIETPAGEFLGETGVGISEVISTSDAKNVTAFEIWLFDKNDIRTVTKVLMSDHAFNDDAIRARLAPKGEAVKAEPNARLLLETASLRVQARIVDIAYSSGPLPPSGVFERITIELAAWKRDGQGSPAPAGAAPGRVNLPGAPTGGTPPAGSSPFPG